MKSILYNFTPEELQKLLDTSNGYADLLRNIGLNPKGGNPDTLKKIIKEYNLDETQLSINRHNLYSECAIKSNKKTPLDQILVNNSTYQSRLLLQRLVEEGYKEYKCEKCGLITWMNNPISLQLHHINYNHNDNRIENLQILCPNCHSQTGNYGGKSSRIKQKREKQKKKSISIVKKLPSISREDLKKLIRTNSFVSIAKECGVTDNAVRKWCIKYNLPSKVSVIKNISDEEWDKI